MGMINQYHQFEERTLIGSRAEDFHMGADDGTVLRDVAEPTLPQGEVQSKMAWSCGSSAPPKMGYPPVN